MLLEELSIRGGFNTRLSDHDTDGAVSTMALRQRGAQAQGGGGGEGSEATRR